MARTFDPELELFRYHLPGLPVVPGVALLTDFARAQWATAPSGPVAFRDVRFTGFVAPGEPIGHELDKDGSPTRNKNKQEPTLNSNALRVSLRQVQDAWLVSGVTPEAWFADPPIVRLRFSRAWSTVIVRNRSVLYGVIMMANDSADATIRRPRMTPDRQLELLNVALDGLREVGYQELSMDLIASRARCSKATLYRQWPGKAQMVVAALYATRPLKAEDTDTGTLRGDLLTMVEQLAAHAHKATALYAALGHAVLTNDDLAVAVRTSLVEPALPDLMGVIHRAVERGELPSWPAAADFLPQLLLGVAITRPMFDGGVADADYLTRCVDDALLPALLHS
jgi:AcrR family transcriptional regulator